MCYILIRAVPHFQVPKFILVTIAVWKIASKLSGLVANDFILLTILCIINLKRAQLNSSHLRLLMQLQ